jgi:hypothetical protein
MRAHAVTTSRNPEFVVKANISFNNAFLAKKYSRFIKEVRENLWQMQTSGSRKSNPNNLWKKSQKKSHSSSIA